MNRLFDTVQHDKRPYLSVIMVMDEISSIHTLQDILIYKKLSHLRTWTDFSISTTFTHFFHELLYCIQLNVMATRNPSYTQKHQFSYCDSIKTPTSHLKALINPAIIPFRISYPLSNINLLMYYWIYFLKWHGDVGDFHSVTAAPPVHSQSCSRRRTTWWVNFPNTLERGHYQAQGQHPISCLQTMQFL